MATGGGALGGGGQHRDPRMRALSYAVLAPNQHNRQPWMVGLFDPDTVALYVDRDRLLPHTDPYSRQIVVGLGCFLGLMDMAAAADGFRVTATLFPDGEDMAEVAARPLAMCRFAKADVAADPLFDRVFERRSLKEPFDIERPVDTGVLETIAVAARAGARAPGSATIPMTRSPSGN